MRTLLIAVATVLSCVSVAAQDLPDADSLRRLRAEDPVAARDLQDQRIHECLRGEIESERVIDACTWVIDVARVAGPLAGEAYVRRARAYASFGDLSAADSDFDNGIGYWDQTQPDEPANIEESGPNISAAPRIRTSAEEHADAHCKRAEFYWRRNDFDRARASFQRALEFHPIACAQEGLESVSANRPHPRGLLRNRGGYDPNANRLDLAVLYAACSSERAAALTETFGPNSSPEQIAALDQGLRNSALASRDVDALHDQWLSMNGGGTAQHGLIACLTRARIVGIEPEHDFAAQPAASPDPFANLPRRNASAGTAMLADSADPNRRAVRQQELAMRAAETERRRAQRAANNAAMWDTIFQVAVIGLDAYVQYETARAQTEAALAQQRNAEVPPTTYAQGGYTVESAPSSGGTWVEGQNSRAQEPAGQRIYDTPEQYAAATGGGGGTQGGGAGRQYLNPQTGRPCVTQTGATTGQHGNGDVWYRIHFSNSCGQTFSVSARRVPAPNGHGADSDGVSGTGILPNGQMDLTCIHYVQTGRGCSGFSEWWVR
ncbi:hypothetical protein U91I_00588 [alpha proteobacterium U9-1i]|nr:hypothetical protein U91I_00588 [alpha proteobacterium U9-1i]